MVTSKKICFLISCGLYLLLTSCAKDFDNLSWKTSVTTPIAKTQLTLGDLLEADSVVQKNTDNSYSLVYRNKIYSFLNPLESLVDIQIKPFIRDVTLESLELEGQNFESRVTLDDLLGDNFFFKLLFPDQTWVENSFGGTSFPTTLDPIAIDFSSIIQSAKLTSGKLTIRLENQLPLDITGVDFHIKNTVGGQTVYQGSYDLKSKEIINDEIDLAQELNGQTIEGNLTVELGEISAQAAQGPDSLFIDYSDYFSAQVTLSDLKVSEARAIFPAQNIVEAKDTVGLIGLGEVQLTRAIIKRGKIAAKVRSTVESEMFMEYYVPSAVLNGQMFSFKSTVPAAPSGGEYYFSDEFSYDGYDFDFRGKDGTLTNTFYNELYARIDSTGEIINLSLQDTISLTIQVEELIPSYVEGYLGQETIIIDPDTIVFDVFKNIRAGSMKFESAKLAITVENGMGVDGVLNITKLSAINSNTGQKVDFPTIPSFNIQEATNLGNGFVASSQTFIVNNAVSILNILPNQIFYNISGQLNPGGNVPAFSDFVYDNSELNAFIDLEVPFSFNAKQLVLSDTIKIEETINQSEEIESGVLRFIIQNRFPLDAKLKLYVLDYQNKVIDSLVTTDKINTAVVGNGLVTASKESIIEYYVEKNQLTNLLQANKLVFEAEFSTPKAGFTKLYTDYSMEVLLTADFKYKVNADL